MKSYEFITEYKADNREGLGAVPHNADVDYFGLRVMMKPSTFLKLALPLDAPTSVDHIVKHLEQGGALGSPFLQIDIPEEWEKNDFDKAAKVSGHEGRNRMLAIQKVEGDEPVEVHLFPRYYRNRHITDQWIKALNDGLHDQANKRFIPGPIFKPM